MSRLLQDSYRAGSSARQPRPGEAQDTPCANTAFVISDFDNNGTTDFLAIGDPLAAAPPGGPTPINPTLDLWWFGRVAGPTSFTQRLVDSTISRNFLASLADVNNDERVDLVSGEQTKTTSGYIATLRLSSYLNQGNIGGATCAWTTDPTNPGGCAFVKVPGINLTDWISTPTNNWVWRLSKDAVDVDGDGNRDLVVVKHRSGGNTPIAVTLVHGNGDGSFSLVEDALFRHNSGRPQSPVNSIVFNDFNNDGLGDVIVGLDDDGDAGSAWFYPGRHSVSAGFDFDVSAAFESFDVNGHNSNQCASLVPAPDPPISTLEGVGFTTSARSFDFDFDGNQDIIFGYNYLCPWEGPSHTVLMTGLATGMFDTMSVIRDYPDHAAPVSYGQHFAIPQRLCQRFSIGP